MGVVPFRLRGRALFWLLLGLGGQLAALLLAEAGPFVRYQHYPLDALGSGLRPWLLAFLLAQAVVVVAAIRRHLAAFYRWVGTVLRPWQAVVVLALLLAASAQPSRTPIVYVAELLLASTIQAVGLATFLLFALELRRSGGSRGERSPGIDARGSRRILALIEAPGPESGLDRLTLVTSAGVFVVTVCLGLFAYEWVPHVPDEVSYIVQSRLLAEGRLFLPTMAVSDAFTPDMILVDGPRWYPITPPGWPALLAIGQWLGAPGLVNPALAALCVLLTRLVVGATHGRVTARLSMLLLGVSPWFLFLAMSWMPHIASLMLALLGAWGVARARSGHAAWALAGGLAVGALSLIRPLEAVMVGVCLGGWAVWPTARGFVVARVRVAVPALLGIGALAAGALNFPYNRALTGEATDFPLMEYTDARFGEGTNALGFGPDRGLGWSGLDPFPGHGPIDVVVNADLNATAINVELFGWVTGSLLFLVPFVVAGRKGRADRAYIVAAACIIAIQSLYWFAGGPDFGARYWFLLIIPCVLLTARGIEWLAARAHGVQALVAALVLGGLTLFVPWRAIDKYHEYRQMTDGARELARTADFEPGSLVLIRGKRHPDFNAAAVLNPVDPTSAGPWYAWEYAPEARRELAAAYPLATLWVVEGPSITGRGYRIVSRPEDSGKGDAR